MESGLTGLQPKVRPEREHTAPGSAVIVPIKTVDLLKPGFSARTREEGPF